ncbi:MAG TPA: YkvA family protein [Candidatus Ratteibacteria bacterium]|nr:YkvA family protein [bacterium]HRR95246.1 YkvA family protein [Candidatus Ratteibacteria bacterium]
MKITSFLKGKTEILKRDTHALYLAYRDPRVPLYAKLFIVCIVGYILSPLDLIPEFIPVVGYLDDIVILSIGVYFSIKMIPEYVWKECKERAISEDISKKLRWTAGTIIVLIWIFIIFVIIKFISGIIKK